jgi:hypothetical protein
MASEHPRSTHILPSTIVTSRPTEPIWGRDLASSVDRIVRIHLIHAVRVTLCHSLGAGLSVPNIRIWPMSVHSILLAGTDAARSYGSRPTRAGRRTEERVPPFGVTMFGHPAARWGTGRPAAARPPPNRSGTRATLLQPRDGLSSPHGRGADDDAVVAARAGRVHGHCCTPAVRRGDAQRVATGLTCGLGRTARRVPAGGSRDATAAPAGGVGPLRPARTWRAGPSRGRPPRRRGGR